MGRKKRVPTVGRLAQKEEKRERILEAAAAIFARRGFSGAVMADIAEEAGIGKGTLYEYFDSKEDLFFAVFEWFGRQTGAEAKVGISALGGSAAERLIALSESVMASWSDMKDLFSLVMEFWSASTSSRMRKRFQAAFRAFYREYREIVSALIREGMTRGEFRAGVDAEAMAASLVGAWDALCLQAWFDEEFDALGTSREFRDVVMRGLVANGGEEKQDLVLSRSRQEC